MERYNIKDVEKKWQNFCASKKTNRVKIINNIDISRETLIIDARKPVALLTSMVIFLDNLAEFLLTKKV